MNSSELFLVYWMLGGLITVIILLMIDASLFSKITVKDILRSLFVAFIPVIREIIVVYALSFLIAEKKLLRLLDKVIWSKK